MECKFIIDNVSKYIDGELNLNDKNNFELHLKSCDDCNNYFNDFKNMIQYLKDIPDVSANVEIYNKIMNKVYFYEKNKNVKYFNFKKYSLTVAAIFVFFIGVTTFKKVNLKNFNLFNTPVEISQKMSKHNTKTSNIKLDIFCNTKNDFNVIEEIFKEYGINLKTKDDKLNLNLQKKELQIILDELQKKLIKIENYENIISKISDFQDYDLIDFQVVFTYE